MKNLILLTLFSLAFTAEAQTTAQQDSAPQSGASMTGRPKAQMRTRAPRSGSQNAMLHYYL